MKLTGMLNNQTGSENSEIAASKPEVPISQPVDMIGTHFQRLYQCFRSQAHGGTSGDTFRRLYIVNQRRRPLTGI